MKITEKKCPNCGANLKFKAGEHNAHCDSCRRDFVIEYEVDDAGNLSDTFDLTPAMTIFGKIFAIHSVIIVLISVVMIITIAFGIFQAINSFNSINERQPRNDRRLRQFRRRNEQAIPGRSQGTRKTPRSSSGITLDFSKNKRIITLHWVRSSAG